MICKAVFDIPQLEQQKEELSQKTEDPSFWKNPALAKDVNRKLADISNKIDSMNRYLKTLESIKESLDFLKFENDPDIFADADDSLQKLNNEFDAFQKNLFYSGPYDANNAILEFHPGAGGTEAHDWAAMLLRMYERYCEEVGYQYKLVDMLEGEEAGISSATLMIIGKNAYGNLRGENGVHRLVRISPFDSGGARHTSFASVSVMPEMDDNINIQINPADLQIDTFRSSGAGGQHINKTSSAIRITHIPTGTVVECQDERSQHKNKDKAMKILRSRIYEAMQEEHDAKIASERKMQVGTGDRSERIRTYNYPQGRLTDHRIGLTIYRLEDILNGNLDEVFDALATADQAAKLANQEA